MDEQLKRRLLVSFIALNLAIILFQLVFNSSLFGVGVIFAFHWWKLLIAVVVGLVVGGITYAVMQLTEG